MTDTADFINQLREIAKITDSEWIESLHDRKRKEMAFHDSHRERHDINSMDSHAYKKYYGNIKYYHTTVRSQSYINEWIRKYAKDNVFLDYACGNGLNAIKAAKAGAKLAVGIDISLISIQNARKYAEFYGTQDNTYFVQADAENTKFPNNSIDTIVCNGTLHHLDLSYAFPELRRLLTPGGRILAVESLGYNPALKLYRQLTPDMRTEWEKKHILTLADVRFAKRFFDIGEIRFWHITSILSTHLKSLSSFLNKVDSVLTRIPLVQLMAWILTFELIKAND